MDVGKVKLLGFDLQKFGFGWAVSVGANLFEQISLGNLTAECASDFFLFMLPMAASDQCQAYLLGFQFV